jgi:hypothetical protein
MLKVHACQLVQSQSWMIKKDYKDNSIHD